MEHFIFKYEYSRVGLPVDNAVSAASLLTRVNNISATVVGSITLTLTTQASALIIFQNETEVENIENVYHFNFPCKHRCQCIDKKALLTRHHNADFEMLCFRDKSQIRNHLLFG